MYFLLFFSRCRKTADKCTKREKDDIIRVNIMTTCFARSRLTGVDVDSSGFSSAESSDSLRPLDPLLYCCSSASSFICSHSSRLKSFSVLAPSRRTRRSVSANSVANVLPVSSAFFVPFCAKYTHRRRQCDTGLLYLLSL